MPTALRHIEASPASVSELMTKAVCCWPEDSVTDVMKLMTMRRIRHVPVDGDQLVGIVSIGDVLKHRLGGEVEADVSGLCGGCSALGYRTAFRRAEAGFAYGTKQTKPVAALMSANDP